MEKIGDPKDHIVLGSIAGPSDTRGGEGVGVGDLNKKYNLRYEDSKDEIQISPSKENPPSKKIITDEVRAQWSTWLFTLFKAITRSIQDEKAKKLELTQAFKASKPILPVNPSDHLTY